MIKAIGFDLDDTLYDRHDVYRQVFDIMQKEVIALDVDFDTFNHVYQDYSNQEFDKFTRGEKTQAAYRIDRTISAYNHYNYPLSQDQALIYYLLYKHFRENIQPRPYIKQAMVDLHKKGYTVFVITNGNTSVQKVKLNQLGILDVIDLDHCFISESIGAAKPNPTVFQHVEDQLGLQSEEILYIGDHLENDIKGALSSGWQTIFYNIEEEASKFEAEGNKTVEDEAALYDYIKVRFLS